MEITIPLRIRLAVYRNVEPIDDAYALGGRKGDRGRRRILKRVKRSGCWMPCYWRPVRTFKLDRDTVKWIAQDVEIENL
jgi:hypothetical protein